MPVIGEYTPPPPACCSSCSPAAKAERQRRRAAGAALIQAAGRRRRGAAGLGAAEDDFLIWWPGDIKSLAERTQTEIWSIAQDYSRAIKSGAIGSDVLAAFKAFYSEWENYREGLSFLSYLNGGTVNTLQSYRARSVQWRDKLASAGVQLTAPAPTGLSSSTPTNWSGAMKWAAAGAIVIGGAMALNHVARIVGPIRKATS